jgi:hypothetical protein
MREIGPGNRVLIRDATNKTLTRRALSAIVPGRDFPVVWACREEDWEAAQAKGAEPDGVPWPAEDVRLAE